MSEVVTKKLKFKGDRPKKKKRTREAVDEGDELAAMAAGDPSGASHLASSYLISGPKEHLRLCDSCHAKMFQLMV